MRKSLLFLMIILLVMSLGSCRKEIPDQNLIPEVKYRPVRLYYENSGGERGITHYYYDLQERNYLAVWQLEDSSRSSMNTHVLDSAGRVVTKSRRYSDGITSVQHYQYSPQGKLLREDFSRSDGVEGVAEYIYGEEGRLLRADCRGLNGWFYGRIEYIWKNGNKAGARILKDSDTIGSIRYAYEDGRLLEETWDFNGQWEQVFRYEYQESSRRTFTCPEAFVRESPWFRLSSVHYLSDGEPAGSAFYSYDRNGKPEGMEFVDPGGETRWTGFEFDTAGLLDRSTTEYGDDRQVECLYWFSVDRKLLVRTIRGPGEEQGSETYRYNDGKLDHGEYINARGGLTGILDFEQDEQGLIRTAIFSGEDGTDARLEYSYDRNYNLSCLQWEFSTGQTRTLEFTYEAAGSLPGPGY